MLVPDDAIIETVEGKVSREKQRAAEGEKHR
jgi:hypothetical protein